MGQALYRKHRPKSLKEVIGQEHITDTLGQSLKQGRISHAYLFTGPRGVGKTSIARILAHEINGLTYDDESSHVDIIEIDAASNRRIDEIRELREKVYVAPTSAKYKVYIIDEVHMLTKEAFNALLKTLEEPPAHVVFILATTDAHKLPATIISRTQRFSFKPVGPSQVASHLQEIAKREKLTVTSEALELLAQHGEGSFRDSISLLDQAASSGHTLEVTDVQRLLGLPTSEAVEELMTSLINGAEASHLINQLSDLYGQGYQAAAIARQLSNRLRQMISSDDRSVTSDNILELLQQLIDVPSSHNPERFLEIIMLRARSAISRAEVKEFKVAKSQPEERSETTSEAQVSAIVAEAPTKKPGGAAFDETVWSDVLGTLKQRHNTLYGVVRMAQPSFDEAGKLRLAFAFAFHEKRIREANNRRLLADIIEELTGQKVSVECVLDKAAQAPATRPHKPTVMSKPDLAAISNIFGSAELLES